MVACLRSPVDLRAPVSSWPSRPHMIAEVEAGENFTWGGCRCARVRALAAYKDFLTLWKDADPDIPILKEARAEYAKLQ